MPRHNEESRLLGTPTRDAPPHNTGHSYPEAPEVLEDPSDWAKPVTRAGNVNAMKRNMSVAKGFIDISLLTANASQLKHLLILGDPADKLYYVMFTGLVLSLILQIATGVLLIIKERFDLDVLEHQKSAEFYNDLTLGFVFATLTINVFVSSLGVSILKPQHPYQNGHPIKQGPDQNWNSVYGRAGTGNLANFSYGVNNLG